ncbi:MAG: hypothetical protein Q4Q06_02595 [Bacteroidota bacterium]|nr:hypothetical protein [Bacteroidota bacterium]
MNNQDLNNLKDRARDIYEQILALQMPNNEKEDLLLEKYNNLLQNTELIIKQNDRLINLVAEVLQKIDSKKEERILETPLVKQEIPKKEKPKQEEIIEIIPQQEPIIDQENEEREGKISLEDSFDNSNNKQEDNKQKQTEYMEPTPKETSSVLEFLHKRVIKDSKVSQEEIEEKPKETATQRLNNLLNNNEKNIQSLNSIVTEPIAEPTSQPKSISDKFEAANKSNLSFTIGMNYKFMFINDLFAGNVQAYESFINELNNSTNLKDSMQIINSARTRYKWAVSSAAYINLTDIIQKRFN